MRTILLALFLSLGAMAQTAALMPAPKAQFFDNNGKPLAGGLLYSYIGGTTTPTATFTDSTGSVANTNPIVLDAAGRGQIWLTTGKTYKFALNNSVGVTLWSVDNVSASPLNNL